MGFVNQLSDFLPEILVITQSLRPLLSPKRTFVWTPDYEKAFRKVKEARVRSPVLVPFDLALNTTLQTDPSRLNSRGYSLLQDHGGGNFRLVQCFSRLLADAKTRYATTELELLAVVWAASKGKFYLTPLRTCHRPSPIHPASQSLIVGCD